MLLLHRALVLVALAIAVVMVVPATSPLLSPADPARASQAEPVVASDDAAPNPAPKPRPSAPEVRGILMTGFSAGGERLDDLLGLVDRTELNAVVIDIKDENGELSWMPRSPRVRAVASGRAKIRDPRTLLRSLKARGIYVIGRIVTFHDPILALSRPDLAVWDVHGKPWHDVKGKGWSDPYSPEVWQYNLDIAREAVDLGFDEIQFDYIRFPSDGDRSATWYPHRDLRAETEVVQQFLAAARQELVPLGVYLSADVFGLATLVEHDLGIGQSIELMAQEVDYLCLMLYPSHYHKPEYDIKDPEREPYKTVAVSLADAKRRIAGTRAKLRPWLQDFSLRVHYTPIQVRQQIKAAEDAGVGEWLLWNARNRYSEDAIRPDLSKR